MFFATATMAYAQNIQSVEVQQNISVPMDNAHTPAIPLRIVQHYLSWRETDRRLRIPNSNISPIADLTQVTVIDLMGCERSGTPTCAAIRDVRG